MSRLEPGYLPILSGVLPAVVKCRRNSRRSQRKRDAWPAGIAAMVWAAARLVGGAWSVGDAAAVPVAMAARLEGGARPAGVEVAAVPVGGGRAGG